MKQVTLLLALTIALIPCLAQQKQGPNDISSTARTSATCNDTSFSHLTGIQDMYIRVYSSSKTKDDGVLVTAAINDTTIAGPVNRTDGLLLRLDRNGQVLWTKKFEEPTAGYNHMAETRAFELNNGNIIFTAQHTTDINRQVWRTIVVRLTSNGNLIWQNGLKSNFTLLNIPKGFLQFQPESATEGLNGDVILGGMHFGDLQGSRFAAAVRLNNLGQWVWDANFGNVSHGNSGEHRLGAAGLQVWLENGQVGFAVLDNGHAIYSSPSIGRLMLDYNNGTQLASKFHRPNYQDFIPLNQKKFAAGYCQFTRRNNGNFLFYGRINCETYPVAVKEHFGVVELDPDFNIKDAYTIASGMSSNWDLSQVRFHPSGKGTIALYSGADVFVGSFEDRVFRKTRVMHHNAAVPDFARLLPQNDSAYILVQGKGLVEFNKLHNLDSSSACLGTDTSLFTFLPLAYTDSWDYLSGKWPNTMADTALDLAITNASPTYNNDRCKLITICDTVKIHGNANICGNQPYVDFTGYKNRECSKKIFWEIDNEAIDSLRPLSDTAVRIWFKNRNWKGKLFAKVFTTECSIDPVDSLEVTVVRMQQTLDLGPDKELCPQNAITLHAGHFYKNYLWQNGSTDSILQVTTAGKYWVSTQDACGNNYSDTIIITSLDVTVDIGPDRVKCNNDTVHLAAPPGFLSYSWSNDYNISSVTGAQVVIFPSTDTTYYLVAEKKPGCFAYDTIRIQVKNSPAISLGADTSICTGDSLVLDAGAGFENYMWNMGNGQQIVVHLPGKYSVAAAYANGCYSRDTIELLSLYPLPAIALDHTTSLCTGSTRTLNAGNFSNYTWHDGSTESTFDATGTGTFYVTVVDEHGCHASDTVEITTLISAPSGFLPGDTAICNYESIVLRATNSYANYSWSTTANARSIKVTEPGEYWLQVTDNNHCTGTDTVHVLPKECLKGFFAPNAFSPNDDDNNDTFRPIVGGKVLSYQLKIYNRNGQLIYSSNSLHRGWDGTMAGKKQNAGMFVWTCQYKIEGQPERMEKGSVMLVR